MRNLTDQEQARRKKLATLREAGLNPYPARISQPTRLVEVQQRFASLTSQHPSIAVAGRVRALRLQGGSTFIDLDDGTAKLQSFLGADELKGSYDQLVQTLDIGDFLNIEGTLFVTQRGEKTIRAAKARIIAKALKPLADKRHGLTDAELRYRHRELDMIANPATRQTIVLRSRILTELRSFLLDRGFIEVETPVLQPVPGGANARPFATHHQALNIDLYLRIAPELYLKRLIIGGLERVFEISRCFRNEGIDHLHNPEFTQIEVYAAYTDYQWMMELTEQMLRQVVTTVHGSPSFMYGQSKVSIPKKIPRVTFREIVIQHGGPDIAKIADQKALAAAAKQLGVELTPKDHRASIIDGIFKTVVRPKIVQPVFVTDHPIELSPLAKTKPDDPRFVERFQLLVAGSELCNAFSELNDPLDQRQRFEAQEKLRATGDDEAQRIDEEFLEALEYGMPPTSGLGLGIDRLTMLLTNNHSIKEVIAFPTLKPKP